MGRGGREGRVIAGGGWGEGWEVGRRENLGLIDCQADLRPFFHRAAQCHASDRVLSRRAGRGRHCVYLGSNGRRQDFELAGGAPI
jgi:hypothetical protein